MPQNSKNSNSVPGLTTRSAPVRAAEPADEQDGVIRAVASTEAPTLVFDWERWEFVNEILLVDGVIYPRGGQVPLQDSHNRSSVRDTLGSAREFAESQVEEFAALECSVSFAGTDPGQEAAQLVREKHITDFSVGYQVLDSVWVAEGETAVVNGKEYSGPIKIARSWKIKELSITPVGADEYAKARSAHFNREGKPMPKESKQPEPGNTPTAGTRTDGQGKTFSEEEVRSLIDSAVSTAVKETTTQMLNADRQRAADIRDACTVARCDGLAETLIREGLTVEQARARIFDHMRENNPPVGNRVEAGPVESEKFRSAVVDGLCLRAGIAVKEPAAGCNEFRGRSLSRIAEECLERAGVNTRGMNQLQLAGAALGIGQRSIVAGNTSDFPLIISNVAHRRLLSAYEEAAVTWQNWCAVVDSPDFKPIQGVNLSSLQELELLDENGEYRDVKLAETGENYCVKTYGNKFTLTRKMVINDDLRAFQQIPTKFGAASKRTVNNHVYSLLSNNPIMADGKALFSADHANLVSDAAAKTYPRSASLDAARILMRRLKDDSGKTTLNLEPRFVLVGSKHETNLDLILTSAALPETGYSSGVTNAWSRKGLIPTIDATLDRYDADAWYLAPDKSETPVEVAFLGGVQTPYLEDMVDFDSDGIKYKCRLDFGVGIMGKNMIKNPGK